MPTTAPTARKQYGLRWLFTAIALVGVLLTAWRVHEGQLSPTDRRLKLIHDGMTKAEVETVLGEPTWVSPDQSDYHVHYQGPIFVRFSDGKVREVHPRVDR
jgi:hypothetical protein